MMFHRQPRLPIDTELMAKVEGTEEQDVDIFMEKMIKARDDLKSKAGANIVKAPAKQKEYYDHRHSPEVSTNFFSLIHHRCFHDWQKYFCILNNYL